MSSGGVSAPQPTYQEMNLQQQEANALKQQQQLITQSVNTQNLLAPYLYQSMGLTPQYNTNGKITGFSQDPAYASLQSKQLNLQGELLDREQAALEGNLPVDPGLITQLNQSEQQLRSEMNANLGPGWETSTSGSTALNQWSQYKSNILDAARRGDLTMAEQLSLGMQGGLQQSSAFLQSGSSGLAGANAGYAGALQGTTQGIGSLLGYMQNNRNMQLQASEYNTSQQNQLFAGLGQGLGALAGIGLSAGLTPATGTAGFLLSSRDYKEGDEEAPEVLPALRTLPIRRWKYREEMGHGTDTHIGPYAEDFRDRFGVGDGKSIAIVDYLGVQLGALKEISRELEDLKESNFLRRAA